MPAARGVCASRICTSARCVRAVPTPGRKTGCQGGRPAVYVCCRTSTREPSMFNDIRLALRTLPKTAGYSLAFILTLGLGIGANTAMFSVINGVLLRPLPYPEADRIMHLRQPQVAAGVEDTSFSFAAVADYRSQATTIDQFIEFGDWTFNVLGRG